MKETFVTDLNTGDDITSFFMVKDKSIRTDSRGKQYLDMLLGDKSGEIWAKKWDISDSEYDALSRIERGNIVKLRGVVTEWNGALQVKIMKVRKSADTDNLVGSDYFKAAPEDPAKMYAYILEKAESISDSDFKGVALHLLKLNKDRLIYYPAASRNHHAEYAGLIWHVKRMLMLAEKITEVYEFLSRDILLCGVIIHDIEKLNEMDADENGVVRDYTMEGNLLGHLIQGAILIGELASELDIPYEKKLMLEHMMISHHYEPDFGSPKRPMFPEAEILHYLDMIDSKMYDFEAALETALPGAFSERTRTLDGRRIYKRSF